MGTCSHAVGKDMGVAGIAAGIGVVSAVLLQKVQLLPWNMKKETLPKDIVIIFSNFTSWQSLDCSKEFSIASHTSRKIEPTRENPEDGNGQEQDRQVLHLSSCGTEEPAKTLGKRGAVLFCVPTWRERSNGLKLQK